MYLVDHDGTTEANRRVFLQSPEYFEYDYATTSVSLFVHTVVHKIALRQLKICLKIAKR